MGSVIGFMQCPQCGYEKAGYDYYYKSREDFIICTRCGYYHAIQLVKDSDEIEYVTEERICIAATQATMKNNPTKILGGVKTKKEMREFRKSVKKDRETIAIAELRYKKDDEWIIEDVLTGEIRLFDDVL